MRVIEVQTAAELERACEKEFERADVLVMAAAVADFRPTQAAQTKLKKDQGVPKLELEPTADVLSALAAAAPAGPGARGLRGRARRAGASQYGRGKLERKRLDAVVVNDVSRPGIGFDADENEVTIVSRGRRAPRRAGEQDPDRAGGSRRDRAAARGAAGERGERWSQSERR